MIYSTVDGQFKTKEEAIQDVVLKQISRLQPINGRYPVPMITPYEKNRSVGVQYLHPDQMGTSHILCKKSVINLVAGNYYYLVDDADFCVMDPTGQLHYFPEDSISEYFELTIAQRNIRENILYVLFDYDKPVAVYSDFQKMLNFCSTLLTPIELIDLTEDQLSGSLEWKRFINNKPSTQWHTLL